VSRAEAVESKQLACERSGAWAPQLGNRRNVIAAGLTGRLPGLSEWAARARLERFHRPNDATAPLRWRFRRRVDAGANRFSFTGLFTHAALSCSAIVPSINSAFRSDPARTSHETFAELVSEENGFFFGTKVD